MAFAAISTAFIALFLFGLALLIAREINLVVSTVTGNVEVAVYLTDPVKPDTVTRIQAELQELPAVSTVTYENKEQACARAQRIFAGNRAIIENVGCDVWPASLRVTLSDPSRFDEITARLACETNPSEEVKCSEPGVLEVRDYRQLLDRLSAITGVIRTGVQLLSVLLLWHL